MTREQLFLSQRALIERVIAWVCAKHGLRGADAEDFRSTVMVRLIEKDYEVVRKFQGLSSFKTYLSAVINRMYLDYQVQRFGKWRPSAEARRLGPVAMRLERLLSRDGLTFDEACGVLLTDPMVKESRDELYAQSLKLPRRVDRRPGEGRRRPAAEALQRVFGRRARREADPGRPGVSLHPPLAPTDAAAGPHPHSPALRGRNHRGPDREVAGEEQKPLYRRKDAILAQLRADLTAEGTDARGDSRAAVDAGLGRGPHRGRRGVSVPPDDAGWPPPPSGGRRTRGKGRSHGRNPRPRQGSLPRHRAHRGLRRPQARRGRGRPDRGAHRHLLDLLRGLLGDAAVQPGRFRRPGASTSTRRSRAARRPGRRGRPRLRSRPILELPQAARRDAPSWRSWPRPWARRASSSLA